MVLASNGLRATVRQIFEVGFFHTDPHPGNLLITEGNTINLIDWGMVGRLTPGGRAEMVDLIAAVVEKDCRLLVDALLTVTAGVPPILYAYPLLGITGYLISAVLGLWLIFDILRNR